MQLLTYRFTYYNDFIDIFNVSLIFKYPGAAKLGTDEKVFYSILTTRSWAQLRQTIAEYESMHGHSLESAVTSEFSANAQRGILELRKSPSLNFLCLTWLISISLIQTVQCAENRPGYLAERLHKALKGLGTNE